MDSFSTDDTSHFMRRIDCLASTVSVPLTRCIHTTSPLTITLMAMQPTTPRLPADDDAKVQDVGSILDILYSSRVEQSAEAAMAAAAADLLLANNNVPVLLEDLHMNLKCHQGGYTVAPKQIYFIMAGASVSGFTGSAFSFTIIPFQLKSI